LSWEVALHVQIAVYTVSQFAPCIVPSYVKLMKNVHFRWSRGSINRTMTLLLPLHLVMTT